VVDVVAIPQSEDAVAEAQHQKIWTCLAEIVVDAVDLMFLEDFKTRRFNSFADSNRVQRLLNDKRTQNWEMTA